MPSQTKLTWPAYSRALLAHSSPCCKVYTAERASVCGGGIITASERPALLHARRQDASAESAIRVQLAAPGQQRASSLRPVAAMVTAVAVLAAAPKQQQAQVRFSELLDY